MSDKPEHYQNTADYITRKLLGKPDGYPVWLRFEDCKTIHRLLKEAADKGDAEVDKLYLRFNTQYKDNGRTG